MSPCWHDRGVRTCGGATWPTCLLSTCPRVPLGTQGASSSDRSPLRSWRCARREPSPPWVGRWGPAGGRWCDPPPPLWRGRSWRWGVSPLPAASGRAPHCSPGWCGEQQGCCPGDLLCTRLQYQCVHTIESKLSRKQKLSLAGTESNCFRQILSQES